jgi:bifunctional enzyme CysN/CysC
MLNGAAGGALPEPASLLRLATVGSVDDGKSTLIGRLLYDARLLPEDQLAHVEEVSARRGDGYVNLALLTDGLRAEREQGITIDVAYRYFRTDHRRFIIADTPGHPQYTRNMVTGASTADLSVILVDARHGVREQSKRHSYVSALLGVPHLVVCVNKMDLVDYDRDRYEEIKRDMLALGDKLGLKDVLVIPVSALNGDNVVDRSEPMSWYDGPTLLGHLETIEVASDRNMRDVRFPVQWVIRPMSDEHHDYRSLAGEVASGVIKRGDEVVVLPSGARTTVEGIDSFDGELEEAYTPMSVSLRLADHLDVSRGDVICDARSAPEPARELVVDLCWMSERPLRPRSRYLLRTQTSTVKAIVGELNTVVDIATLDHEEAGGSMDLNDIGRVNIRLASPLVCDPYRENRATGCFVLVDESTNDTVGAGMIVEAHA